MNNLLEYIPPKGITLLFRILGFAAAVTGLVTAILAGIQPVHWFLIAMCFFLGVICAVLFRIKAMIEKKT